MNHIKRNFKAVSPVLAVLMMIAVAIAGSLVLYAWFMGYIDFSLERINESIMIPSVANDPTDTDLIVYVMNNGEVSVQLEESDCLYVNGRLALCEITGVTVARNTATIGKGETATLTVVYGAAYPGEKIEVKVTTLLGNSAEATAYPAGTTYIPLVLDHFEFDPIVSPQISGVPFTVTIRAINQYGKTFTSYNDANVLYSNGTMIVHEFGSPIQGVFTLNVSFTGSATNVTIGIAAMSDTSKNGTSNTFDVLSWLVGWNSRKSHVIENVTGAGTDYQVMIHVHKGQLGDDGWDVYLDDDDCRDDFGDIRFTGSDGMSQLSFWMESVNHGSDALFWVKVAEDLSTENQTIYLYYDNPQATTTSNGDATFVYFDDFTGTTTSEDMTILIEDPGHARIYLDTANDELFGEKVGNKQTIWDVAFAYFPQIEPGYAIRTSCLRHVDEPQGNTMYVVAFHGNLDWPPTDAVGTITYCRDIYSVDRVGYTFIKNSTGSTGYNGTRELDTWQIIDAYWDYNYAEILWDGISVGSTDNSSYIPTDPLYPTIGIQGGADVGHTEVHFDWVVVRKYVQIEPSHGDWGEEENWPSS